MKIRHKQILTYILLCFSFNVFGQEVSIDDSSLDRNRIDSLADIIDKRNPPKNQLDFTKSIDSLIGAQIVTIEKQTFRTLCKYILHTNKTGPLFDIKFIELYLSNDSLIKATIYYDIDKNDFWKMYYYEDNTFFNMMASPRCMRINLNENGQEYIAIVNKLRTVKIKK